MNSKSVKALVPFVLILALGIGLVVFLGETDQTDTGGPADLPAAEEGTGGVPVEEPVVEVEPESDPSVIDPAVTVEDPVPDSLVSVLFELIEADGTSPLMEETYTVEFVETTDTVKISGEFAQGEMTFLFEFTDGTWEIVE